VILLHIPVTTAIRAFWQEL